MQVSLQPALLVPGVVLLRSGFAEQMHVRSALNCTLILLRTMQSFAAGSLSFWCSRTAATAQQLAWMTRNSRLGRKKDTVNWAGERMRSVVTMSCRTCAEYGRGQEGALCQAKCWAACTAWPKCPATPAKFIAGVEQKAEEAGGVKGVMGRHGNQTNCCRLAGDDWQPAWGGRPAACQKQRKGWPHEMNAAPCGLLWL